MPPLLTCAAKSNVHKTAGLVRSIKMLRHWCSIVGSSVSVDGGFGEITWSTVLLQEQQRAFQIPQGNRSNAASINL